MIVGGTDTETTGLLDPDHRIIEVCIQRWDIADFLATGFTAPPVKLDTLVERIDPERSIDAKAQAVHGIMASDLVGKPRWPAVASLIRDRLDSCDMVVAHNGFDFDFPFFLQEFKRVGVPDPEFEPFDTMVSGRWATPFGKSPTLAELCWSCGVPYDPAQSHAAEYDVDVMMKSFFMGLRRGVFSLST